MTHMIIKTGTDTVVTTKTFLNEHVESTYGKIQGYTHWMRKDHQGQDGGGIAVCHKNNLQPQPLNAAAPEWMEVMFFRVVLAPDSKHYCPQWQGQALLDSTACFSPTTISI